MESVAGYAPANLPHPRPVAPAGDVTA
jgi:hypothetical protein